MPEALDDLQHGVPGCSGGVGGGGKVKPLLYLWALQHGGGGLRLRLCCTLLVPILTPPKIIWFGRALSRLRSGLDRFSFAGL